MKCYYSVILFFAVFSLYAQIDEEESAQVETDSVTIVGDPKYREDQFYTSIAYVMMQDKPGGYRQYSFSTGISIGFLRDMPVNEDRTYAIALGLGYSYNNIKHNLAVSEADGMRFYTEPDGDMYDKNKLVLHYVELPLELRWRTSNAVSHKFWRIYTGFKVSYLFADKAQIYPVGGGSHRVKGNDDLNKFIYGTYVAAGWNTWNFYFYYGLNPVFKQDAKLEGGQDVNLRMLKFGLMFYIL